MSDIKEEPVEEREAEQRLDVHEEHDEEDIVEMKKRLQDMESEATKLREMQQQQEGQDGVYTAAQQPHEPKEAIDSRSVFVGNVDYAASPEEIQDHFKECGSINRVTILLDKFSGQPKGYAYVEFSDPDLVAGALVLNDSMFRGRNLKVVPKRTNVPGLQRGRGRGAPMGGPGYGGRGGGGYGGGYGGGGGYRGRGGYGGPPPFSPRGGYRGGFRGSRGRGYAPY